MRPVAGEPASRKSFEIQWRSYWWRIEEDFPSRVTATIQRSLAGLSWKKRSRDGPRISLAVVDSGPLLAPVNRANPDHKSSGSSAGSAVSIGDSGDVPR